MKVFTIGHSNRKLEEFIEILKYYKIDGIIDVRRFPTSKKFPWFNKDKLENVLKENGIKYIHFKGLGGYRKEGYKNFAKTKEFEKEIKKLEKILLQFKNPAIMCSEKFPWKCHRRYISKKLKEDGFKVEHIIKKKKTYVSTLFF